MPVMIRVEGKHGWMGKDVERSADSFRNEELVYKSNLVLNALVTPLLER